MKKEIVVKVQMRCDKCRTKSMELAASADGVSSVSLTGEDRNQLVVVGDGVDAVSLATVLRKKVGPTDIIRVGEPNKGSGDKKSGKGEEKGGGGGGNNEKKDQKSKDSDSGKEKEKGEKKDVKKNDKKDDDQQQYQYQYQYQQQQMPKMEYLQAQQQWYSGYLSYPQPQIIVYDSPNYPNPNCSIM